MSIFENAKRAFIGRADDEYDRDYDEEYDEEYDDDEDEERPRRKLFSFLSRDKDEYDDYVEEEENTARRRAYSDDSRYSSRKSGSDSSKFYSSGSSIKYGGPKSEPEIELVVLYPSSFDDSAKLVKEVKEGKITVFDISEIPDDGEARRIVDYICGAAEGMECPFSRLCPSIFCIAPKGVKLTNRKNRF